MKSFRIVSAIYVLYVPVIFLAGCGNKFWDPTQIGRFHPVPSVNIILDSLDVAEEKPPAWETGEEPRPADAVDYRTDYVFGPGDVVSIAIFELLNEGQMYANQYVVTETGKVSIPDVGVVEAAGLTESQLEEQIRQILSPNVIKEPSVYVTMLRSESRVFSILGSGVPRPGRYGIPRYDYRLTDALATAGGISQFNTSYVYVSRVVSGEEALAEPDRTGPAGPAEREAVEPERIPHPEQEMLEIIAPTARRHRPVSDELVVASAEMATDRELAEAALPEKLWPVDDENRSATELQNILSTPDEPARIGASAGTAETIADSRGHIEWVFREGKWVPVQIGRTQPAAKTPGAGPEKPGGPLAQRVPAGLEWGEIGTGGVQRRVIRIFADKLLSGDPKYNIVIRPGDNVHVPVDIIGEFCIMGNINRQGFINITGRPMTLKMAIAAAGGLGPLAWPKRCEVVRRIGKKREETVMVDLDKIARGEQPDFFIKPNDLINIGTHPTARWRAVLRNAFRATYGFGFIYDRNFADRDYGTGRPFDWIF